MRIACPSCGAEYEVPDSMLAGRSTVRCARCGVEWRPGAEAEPAPPAETLPGAAAPRQIVTGEATAPRQIVGDEAAAPSQIVTAEATTPPDAAEAAPPLPLFVSPRERDAVSSGGSADAAGSLLLIGWVLTVLVIGGALVAGYGYRDHLMSAWPPSTRLYAALGLR